MLEKIRIAVCGKKTYILAGIAMATALLSWAVGELTLGEFVTVIFGSLGGMFLRAGIAKSEPYEIEIEEEEEP